MPQMPTLRAPSFTSVLSAATPATGHQMSPRLYQSLSLKNLLEAVSMNAGNSQESHCLTDFQVRKQPDGTKASVGLPVPSALAQTTLLLF